MTSTGNEPLEHAVSSPDPDSDEHGNIVAQAHTEHADGGYDDRQESLEEADRDLFERKDHEDPEARYQPDDQPLTEPRKSEH